VRDSEGGDGFDSRVFGLLQQAEEKHFWFIVRREIILDALKRHVSSLSDKTLLEIGCGNGNILRYLRSRTRLSLAGGDFFLEGLEFCRLQTDAPLYQIDATRLPFRNSFNIVALFDVLEHIEDDERVLEECHKALRSSGRLVLTVPTCPALWSSFDVFAHHKRRYTGRALRKKLMAAGFKVERASHFMSALFPLVYSLRLLQDRLGRPPADTSDELPSDLRVVPVLNSLGLGMLRLERLLMRYMDLPFGTSLLVMARKV